MTDKSKKKAPFHSGSSRTNAAAEHLFLSKDFPTQVGWPELWVLVRPTVRGLYRYTHRNGLINQVERLSMLSYSAREHYFMSHIT